MSNQDLYTAMRIIENAVGGNKRESQADKLIAIADSEDVELFYSPSGEPYATVPVKDHCENWPVKSGGFGKWLRWQFYRLTGKAPSTQAFQNAVNTIAAKAIFQGQERRVFVRIAGDDDVIYLDLVNDAWQSVRVDAEGWKPIDKPPVRFIRRRGMLPLPIPERGCGMGALRTFANIPDDAAWVLVLSFLVAAFRARGLYPVLVLHGEQGSAKSTLERLLRELIDPNVAPLRSEPRNARDLIIAATNSWMLAFDNLSHLQPWFSDALCRLATGGGFSTRELYTDSEEVLFDATRPVILNGIEELATRGDLLDRALILYLPQISDEKRKREAEFWRDFQKARPELLGTILDAVSTALRRLPTTHLKESPRMADFAAWGTAAESAFGVSGASFMDAYHGNRESANELVLDASPVPQAMKLLMASDERFMGTATDLLTLLNQKVSDQTRRERSWPKNGRALSGCLRRLAPNLRQIGIDIKMDGPKRSIRIEKSRNSAFLTFPGSAESVGQTEEATSRNPQVGTQIQPDMQIANPSNFAFCDKPSEINRGNAKHEKNANFPAISNSEGEQLFEEGSV